MQAACKGNWSFQTTSSSGSCCIGVCRIVTKTPGPFQVFVNPIKLFLNVSGVAFLLQKRAALDGLGHTDLDDLGLPSASQAEYRHQV